MPPRFPLVLVFFAFYFAIIVGGGADALARFVTLPLPSFTAEALGVGHIRLTIAELVGATAALLAAPDAALRPARTRIDKVISCAVAIGALAIAAAYPKIATIGYGGLTAIALGDAAAALMTKRRSAAAL
ncbi:MAG: hypothetical protein MRY74_12490 [Neomegalonema sp.]|nr:hypothetical protein [Neomegalonema sp.]